jgi:lipid-A-disaccharide synthase
MLVAGEASGDGHGARLVEAIRQAVPGREVHFFGSAGPRMRAAGVEAVVQADELAIMGLPEIVRSLPMFLGAFRKLTLSAAAARPDVVVLIDFPEFNLKLAKSLKRKGIRVVYYISPQLWAWRKYRRHAISRYVDLLLTILPFEADWYRERGITNVRFVGNPLTNEVRPRSDRAQFCARHGLDPARPIVALLPGSRHKELTRILPGMLTAAALQERSEILQFVIALASTRRKAEVESVLRQMRQKGEKTPRAVAVVKDETYDLLYAADAAAVASGTATLEAGLAGVPMAVVYKASGFNYRLVRPLINVEHFGLINLIAGKRVVKEFIQDDFTPEALAAELERLLDSETNARVRSELREVAGKLGTGGASRRAAEAILELIDLPAAPRR